MPKNKLIAEVSLSLENQQAKEHNSEQVADVNVFRDLGPMGRKMIKPT
jgi:hypothetical protein